jgi:hypothetical protein
MRVFVLAVTTLLASSTLSSFAQDSDKGPGVAPQTGNVAAPIDQTSQRRDQRNERDQTRSEERETGSDTRRSAVRDDREIRREMMRRDDSGRIETDSRERGRAGMTPDSDVDRIVRGRDMDRGARMDRSDDSRDPRNYPERAAPDWDRAYRDRDNVAGRPRQTVKVCLEYDNGDEYCRLR